MITPFPGEKENWSLVATYKTKQELHDLCRGSNIIRALSKQYKHDPSIIGFYYCHKGIFTSYIGTTNEKGLHDRQISHLKGDRKRIDRLLAANGSIDFWVATLRYPIDYDERIDIEKHYIHRYYDEYNLINETVLKVPDYIKAVRDPSYIPSVTLEGFLF